MKFYQLIKGLSQEHNDKVIAFKERFDSIDKGKLFVNGGFLLQSFNLQLFETRLYGFDRKKKGLEQIG